MVLHTMRLCLLMSLLVQAVAADNSPLISHDLWTELLTKHVNGRGMVDYPGFRSDEKKLNTYLASLEANPPRAGWTRQEKMAYWINAYNAYTIRLVLTNYPCRSITELEEGKPWDKKFIQSGGRTYSLNQVENEILRREFSDPRIHFAINCASVSCPGLLNEAFTAAALEQQLQKVTRDFINDPSRNTITAGAIQVSKVFDWYAEDFTAGGTLIDFLNRYSTVSIRKEAVITFLDYDWSLNEG